MQRFVLLVGVLIAVLVAAGCSAGGDGPSFSRHPAPGAPVPGLDSGAGGDDGVSVIDYLKIVIVTQR